MAAERIHTEHFLKLALSFPVLDVRSPGEYQHAHIPGAFSFPLFSDEERKQVGTAYKQQGREAAIRIGLEFFGPRMRPLVEEAETICSHTANGTGNRTLLVHCWRGGMRSSAIAWLLDLYGFKVYTLQGGYKKYRHYVLNSFRYPFEFLVIGGYTGSGKTGLLQALENKGERVIDLEAIAVHKGSAFGNIGMPDQPGQEMFENLLSKRLSELTSEFTLQPPIWIEDEAQRIGLVNLPNEFWATLRRSPVLFLSIPFEARLEQIVREYGHLDLERMIGAIGRISEKLGHLNAKNAISALKEGKTAESFAILLRYYDKYYLRSLHNREQINSLLRTVESKSITAENADLLIRSIPSVPQKI